MGQCYFERRLLDNHSATTATDIARHLQRRQYLGATLIVCDNPFALLSATRKQWLQLQRNLQKQRASTLNTEEILRLTHVIMHMQHMRFAARPTYETEADVYFTTPTELVGVPQKCRTVYVVDAADHTALATIRTDLPDRSLFVVYSGGETAQPAECLSKEALEEHILVEWQRIVAFLMRHDLHPSNLIDGNVLQLGAMDEALDTLLSVSQEFLREAAALQHAINLAQPVNTIPSDLQKQFEAVARLAHRVQALTPGNFSNYLLKIFGDSEAATYFLRDASSEELDFGFEQFMADHSINPKSGDYTPAHIPGTTQAW